MIIGVEALQALAAEPPLMLKPDLFYFLRHGETEGNATGVVQFPTIPLNERGRTQAHAAAERLAAVGIDRIVASTFQRAAETARIVAGRLGRPVERSDQVVERRFGEFQGTASAMLDWSVSPKGGETLAEFVERTRRGVAMALEPGATTLIVAHGGTLRVVAAGLGIEEVDRFVRNATPLRFARTGRRWAVEVV